MLGKVMEHRNVATSATPAMPADTAARVRVGAAVEKGIIDVPLSAERFILEGAVLPIANAGADSADSAEAGADGGVSAAVRARDAVKGPYGVVTSHLLCPPTGGSYVVDFMGGNAFGASRAKLLAYIDPFGRVFETDRFIEAPPAREPDLSFAKYTDQPEPDVQTGCVYVWDRGEKTDVAQYRCVNDRYSMFDSWYGFKSYGTNLSYEEAFARAYLAFVYRPWLGAQRVPGRGLESVFDILRHQPGLQALRSIASLVREADADPAFQPPALVRCLVKWLETAGLTELDAADVPNDELRLVRTAKYADIFYLASESADSPVTKRQIWALEAALNRFKLVADAFGDNASVATDVDCARWDAYLIETAGVRQPVVDRLFDAPVGCSNGEWMLRRGVCAALENAKLPFRVDMSLRADVAAGLVALDLVVPDASFMPEWVWRDGVAEVVGATPTAAGAVSGAADAPARSGWLWAGDAERASQAARYAMHVGLLLAAAAFEASSQVQCVLISARMFVDDVAEEATEGHEGGAVPTPAAASASFSLPVSEHMIAGDVLYNVSLNRGDYAQNGFAAERAGDPQALFVRCAVPLAAEASSALDAVRELPSARFRKRAPELAGDTFAAASAVALGADNVRDLHIQYESTLRLAGEGLADRIAGTASVTEAIAACREAEAQAKAARDDAQQAACRRLMAGLVDGTIDMADQNAMVASFVGEDRCRVALNRARTIAQERPEEAISILSAAVTEAEALDGYVDGAVTVHRVFDAYASRVLYNLARRDGSIACRQAIDDAGKQMVLASDAFYLCHLDLVSLLENSFERADDALRYGKRACELAPTALVGFRALARAYMLVGDMESSKETLERGLLIASQPNDIAVAYYQLAYVLWRLGKPRVGAACYLKSMQTASVVYAQSSAELKELLDETGVVMPERDEIDAELAQAGVPVAPVECVLDALGAGAAAAADEGLFLVARNLLSLRLRYRPDDALTAVLRSLEV
ncbi:hypothetical protein [Adlercreutzia sp. ZJ141]|uniref:hypothetical protein n=1 Tax=Adlercreutzia sp. ZJ141 TaxID=2709406 RepID=UPI001F14AA98|nr:hypothetical protein [Adlercreutzia sp. ZJ141]